MEFEQVKSELLELAKKANACDRGYNEAENAETFGELLDIIVDNIGWCIGRKIATARNLKKWFNSTSLNARNVFISGKHQLDIVTKPNVIDTIIILGRSYANIIARDNSKIIVILGESGKADIQMRDRSYGAIVGHNKSEATVVALHKSSTQIRQIDDSIINTKKLHEASNIILSKG